MTALRNQPLVAATIESLYAPSEAWSQRQRRRGNPDAFKPRPRPVRNGLEPRMYEYGAARADHARRALAASFAEHGPSPAEFDDNPALDHSEPGARYATPEDLVPGVVVFVPAGADPVRPARPYRLRLAEVTVEGGIAVAVGQLQRADGQPTVRTRARTARLPVDRLQLVKS